MDIFNKNEVQVWHYSSLWIKFLLLFRKKYSAVDTAFGEGTGRVIHYKTLRGVIYIVR